MTVLFHSGRKRSYIHEYFRIPAKIFKHLLNLQLGFYKITGDDLGEGHNTFELVRSKSRSHSLVFTIKDREIFIPLQLDSRSASKKLYLLCPHCHHQRQHLYAVEFSYACRQCLGLHYATQSERPLVRLRRKIRRLRKALWGNDWPKVLELGQYSKFWPKPKWMKWDKFIRERNKIAKLEEEYWKMESIILSKMFSS